MLTKNGWIFVVLSAACFAVGLRLNYRELIVLGVGFLLCLVFGALWMLLRPKLEVERDVIPSRVEEGEATSGVIRITNIAHRRSPPVTAVEAFAGQFISLALPGIAHGRSHTSSYFLPANRRGCYAVGPLRITHSDPLRLVDFTRSYGSEATLWVRPRTHKMSPVPTGRSEELEGPTNAGAPRGGIAFHSLREYEPGDDLRLIHWRSTARLNKLMVRHTVITNEPRIMILLDTAAGSYPGDAFEDAVRITASLVRACADRRYPTEFRTTGGVRGSVDPAGGGYTDVLDKLAAAECTKDDPGLPALIKLSASREHGVSLGVVTGLPPPNEVTAVGRVRGRFQMVTLVQVGQHVGSGAAVSGVLSITGETSEEVAQTWKHRVGA